ncbi:MAG: transporter substrate-binding domain-containing protein [Caldilineaceae bacterium]
MGVISHTPWVTGDAPGAAGGPEGRLVAAFAEELGVAIDWRWGSAEEIFDALTHYDLDLAIGGITDTNPWHSEVAFTVPYYTNTIIVAIPPTASPISELNGIAVGVPPGSTVREQLAEEGAIPVLYEPLSDYDGPVATDAWAVAGMGWRPTGIELRTDKHVMAVPRGENAMIMRLETFLLEHKDQTQIADQLWEATTQ